MKKKKMNRFLILSFVKATANRSQKFHFYFPLNKYIMLLRILETGKTKKKNQTNKNLAHHVYLFTVYSFHAAGMTDDYLPA